MTTTTFILIAIAGLSALVGFLYAYDHVRDNKISTIPLAIAEFYLVQRKREQEAEKNNHKIDYTDPLLFQFPNLKEGIFEEAVRAFKKEYQKP